MSHISIVISRAQASPSSLSSGPTSPEAEPPVGIGYASVSYTPPDSMSDADVTQMIKKLYKQIKDLGN